MDQDKFYVIQNNIVINVAIYKEEDAVRLRLKRYPITNDLGVVDIGWTYLPAENTFLPPPRDILKEWATVRGRRNALLETSDLFLIHDRWVMFNQDEQHALITYRQALRDVPQNFTDPKEVKFPAPPLIMANILQEEKFKPSTPEV